MSSTEKSRTIEQQVLQYLRCYRIPRGSAVMVALSGGPDSLCLLQVLRSLKQRFPLRLSAVYLDHGIRPGHERHMELEFVNSVCAKLGVELFWERLPQGLLEEESSVRGRSLEEAAREARYRFLKDTASRQKADYIALGHTADDQVETVVMRFFQGIGLSGLPGIPPVRDNLIRPLIGCTRERILGYLREHGSTYLTDSTNRDARYLRNAVRRELLPAAERIFPGLRGSVLSLSERLSALRSYVEAESRRRLKWTAAEGGYGIAGGRFIAVPGLLRLFSVTALLNSMGVSSRRVPYRFLRRVEEDRYLTSRRVVLQGYGIRLFWRGERLILAADVVGKNEKGYFIEESEAGRVYVPEAGLCFEFGPLVRAGDRFLFRSSRTGDRITLQGGSKTVRRLFAEWQASGCWKIPVVERRDGIVAVLGGLFGYEDRFHPDVSLEQGKALKSMVHRYDVEVE
ncbi:MAG: tRNA lysidine(34) synthetase TilS [Spirochaetales bacterium]|nr:tRNA lysidine(34) synthetase TilS [Spirochaetales bacterium]